METGGEIRWVFVTGGKRCVHVGRRSDRDARVGPGHVYLVLSWVYDWRIGLEFHCSSK